MCKPFVRGDDPEVESTAPVSKCIEKVEICACVNVTDDGAVLKGVPALGKWRWLKNYPKDSRNADVNGTSKGSYWMKKPPAIPPAIKSEPEAQTDPDQAPTAPAALSASAV